MFVIRCERKTNQLYLSLSTSHARLHLTEATYDKPDTPSGFCMLLRKYLETGVITAINTLAGDRIIIVNVRTHDELGRENRYVLYQEIMGRYANLVIVAADGRIIDAYKHVSPFEDQQRTIEKGAIYVPPLDQKIDPEDRETALDFFREHPDVAPKAIVAAFRGVSPLLAAHLANPPIGNSLVEHFQAFLDITPAPTLFTEEYRQRFYYFDLFPPGDKRLFPTLSALLDEAYGDIGRRERMRQISKNLLQFVKRELEKNVAKLEKLRDDLAHAGAAEALRMKGDLLIQFQHEISKGQSAFKAYSYEAGQEVEVALEPLLSPLENANAYYRKYKKAKSAIPYIEEQLALTQRQVQYFSLIDSQIETATQIDLEEIAEELSSRGYTRKKLFKQKRKEPNYLVFVDEDGCEILVGKNNLQNEHITHELAKPDEWWFHTKDYHGAHVLVRSVKDLSETTIRTAAALAAHYSQGRHSSSVPVDYTRKRHVRKLPGEAGCFVTYQNHKTIYIDPDPGLGDRLAKKRK